MDIKDYSIDEHTHRFAVWTSARAASRSRLKNTEIELLIDKSGLRQEVESLRKVTGLNEDYYRNWIRKIGEIICKLVDKQSWGVFTPGVGPHRPVTKWIIKMGLINVHLVIGEHRPRKQDSGTILPGHGGILAWFDTLLSSASFVFCYLIIFP